MESNVRVPNIIFMVLFSGILVLLTEQNFHQMGSAFTSPTVSRPREVTI